MQLHYWCAQKAQWRNFIYASIKISRLASSTLLKLDLVLNSVRPRKIQSDVSISDANSPHRHPRGEKKKKEKKLDLYHLLTFTAICIRLIEFCYQVYLTLLKLIDSVHAKKATAWMVVFFFFLVMDALRPCLGKQTISCQNVL